MDGLRWLQAQWDRTAGWALIGGGAMMVGTAAAHARQGLYVPDQFSFLMSGGLGGLACAALGAALLLSASLHDEWRAFDAIESAARDVDDLDVEDGRRGTLGRWARAEWDRILGAALVAAAFAWLLVGYRQLADSLYPPAQVAYLISTGLSALACLLLGLAVWLFADLRDEEHKLSQVARSLRSAAGSEAPARPVARPAVVVLLLGATVAVLGVGWARAADAVNVDRALQGLNIAVAGLGGTFLVVVGGTVAVRRRFVDRASQVLAHLREPEIVVEAARPAMYGQGYWTVAGLRRFHRSSCPALASARGERRPVSGSQPGLEPCLLCDAGE
jgi:hypothetical protein